MKEDVKWIEKRKSKNFYFPHDSNAHADPKIVKLIYQYGYEGYGFYWRLIESMMHETNYMLDIDGKYGYSAIIQMLNSNLDFVEQYIQFCCDVGLFEYRSINEKKYLCSVSLLNRMGHVESVREARREAGRISALKRAEYKKEIVEQQKLNKTATQLQQVNKSKVNKSKVNNSSSTSIPFADANVIEHKKPESFQFPIVDLYHKWFLEKFNVPPKINGREVVAAKSISKYLIKACTDDLEKAESAWVYILHHWEELDDFTKQRNRLVDIDSGLQNIITKLKNGKKVSKIDAANNNLREQLNKAFDE